MGSGVVPLLVGNYDIKNFGRRWETARNEVGVDLSNQLEDYIRVKSPQETISKILEYKKIYDVGYEKDYGITKTKS
jgi:hypothetical protein